MCITIFSIWLLYFFVISVILSLGKGYGWMHNSEGYYYHRYIILEYSGC